MMTHYNFSCHHNIPYLVNLNSFLYFHYPESVYYCCRNQNSLYCCFGSHHQNILPLHKLPIQLSKDKVIKSAASVINKGQQTQLLYPISFFFANSVGILVSKYFKNCLK